MLYFSDATINETGGNYQQICHLMLKDGSDKWMLSSSVTVANAIISSNFMLHLWNDGIVYIMKTDRPMQMNTPDDDLRELNTWCKDNGWTKLTLAKELTEDPAGLFFWMRTYRSGLVESDELKLMDDEEMERLSKVAQIEEAEEESSVLYERKK